MLRLAGIDVNHVLKELRRTHTEARPLVGRDLTPFLYGEGEPQLAGEPVYFMTDDDITRGSNQETLLGRPYNSVLQPNHIQTVIAFVQTRLGRQLWKYSTYYDNPQFWSTPGVVDQVLHQMGDCTGKIKPCGCVTTEKRRPVPEQLEMYNLTEDPLERVNLAYSQNATPESRLIERALAALLVEQCYQKRLVPTSGPLAGTPSCSEFDPFGSSNRHLLGEG